MNRVDRLMAIVTTLQSRKYVPLQFLADKYGISTRTVYRDIRALHEIGIPIMFEDQKGYSVMQGFFLPPISLSLEEANALILISSLAQKFGDKSAQKHVDNAMVKIKSVLRHSDREQLDSLSSNIRVYAPESEDKLDILTNIQQAILEKKILNIEYTNNSGLGSKRDIEPIGFTFYNYQWHLIAWCWNRYAYRDFKLDQISNLITLETSFKKENHIDINQYIQSLT